MLWLWLIVMFFFTIVFLGVAFCLGAMGVRRVGAAGARASLNIAVLRNPTNLP